MAAISVNQPDLPQAEIQRLPDNFWSQESLVNSVWLGLLAKFFPGSWSPAVGTNPIYVIAPEGQSTGTRPLRADLLVYKIADHPAGTVAPGTVFDAILHYEGKGEGKTAPDLRDIRGQLATWFQNAGAKVAGGKRIWAVGAAGRYWNPYLWTGSDLSNIGMSTTAGQFKVSVTKTEIAPLDLTTAAGYANALNFLAFAATFPHPITGQIGGI